MFQTLANARTIGMAANPIQLSEILAYCRHLDLTVEEGDAAIRIIQTIDLVWLTEVAKRAAKS